MKVQYILVLILTFYQLNLATKRKPVLLVESFMEPCSPNNTNYILKMYNSTSRVQNGFYFIDYVVELMEDVKSADLEASNLTKFLTSFSL